MKYLLPLTAFILSSAHATTGTGEYFYGPDTSENIACQVAEDFARDDVIRNFLGESLESNTVEQCFNEECFLLKETSNSTFGIIKKVNKKEITKTVEAGKLVCSVTIDADVEKIQNDIAFHIRNDNLVLKVGTEIKFYGISNKKGNLYIFNSYMKKYHKLYQTKINEVDTEFTVPKSNEVIVAKLPDGVKISKEKLVFLFTELDIQPKSVYTDYEMQKMLEGIPITKRRTVNRLTQIVR